MDDIVLRGMAKWPNVPVAYGWLALDRRGNWLLKGERISNPSVIAFIGRNYDRDHRGRWFFQNGPQRVYVACEYTPLVYRVIDSARDGLALQTHTGKSTEAPSGAWMDEEGSLLLETNLGIGVLHDADLEAATAWLADSDGAKLDEDALPQAIDRLHRGLPTSLFLRTRASLVPLRFLRSTEVAQRFRFVAQPVEEQAATIDGATRGAMTKS